VTQFTVKVNRVNQGHRGLSQGSVLGISQGFFYSNWPVCEWFGHHFFCSRHFLTSYQEVGAIKQRIN
jgi:hypothetical protein